MTEKHLFWLAIFALLTITTTAILGKFFDELDILFDALLTISGIIAGYLISNHFYKKAKEQSLGNIASNGFRLSINIFDSLNEILDKIESLKKSKKGSNTASAENTSLKFDIVAGKLQILRHIALSSNDQWRDLLPAQELKELEDREKIISLSKDKDVQITLEKRLLKK